MPGYGVWQGLGGTGGPVGDGVGAVVGGTVSVGVGVGAIGARATLSRVISEELISDLPVASGLAELAGSDEEEDGAAGVGVIAGELSGGEGAPVSGGVVSGGLDVDVLSDGFGLAVLELLGDGEIVQLGVTVGLGAPWVPTGGTPPPT